MPATVTLTNCYTSLLQYKQAYYPQANPSGGPDPQADTVDDVWIASCIRAASRKIDQYCDRQFYQGASNEVRYYTAEYPDLLNIDDMIAAPSEIALDIAGNRTYSVTLASTDYDMEPYNAPATTQPRPYTKIRRAPYGRYAFPVGYRGQAIFRAGIHKGVRITGQFGFCPLANVPDQVVFACLLQTERWVRRKDAIFGVMGSSEFGTVMLPSSAFPKIDPDVAFALEDFRNPDGIRGV